MMSNANPALMAMQQMVNRPLSILPSAAETTFHILNTHLGFQDDAAVVAAVTEGVANDAGAMIGNRSRTASKPYRYEGGVAIIDIKGVLVKEWFFSNLWGITGYNQIKAQIMFALADDDVKVIFLNIDSPGGMVAGVNDLADLIWHANERNGGKYIFALANELAASAAFELYSCADDWAVTRTSEVGSVGTLMMHVDVQKAMNKGGYKVRVFRSGKHKAETNPYEDMPPEAAARIQGMLDGMREIFIETAARNFDKNGKRQKSWKKTLSETEGLTYVGDDARDRGFASIVASEDQVWTQLLKRASR